MLSFSNSNRPFIIAEMSGNHNGSLERALQLVDAAAEAGADAIKIQTYTADTMTLNVAEREFLITDEGSLWKNRNLYELYQEAHTPWEWHLPIFERARARGIIPFSTPFDPTAVDFLEELGVDLYKIASFENTDLPLIRKAAATGKPMIISTGLASIAEIYEAVEAARDAGCKDLVLLKTTSSYPATPENSNLRTIPHLKQLFGCEVGLSDHTLGIGAAIASIAYGASVIEKHFTLSRDDGGVDSAFSLNVNELRSLVTESERAWQALGKISYGFSESEKNSLVFRRSLYVVEDMKAGEIITANNVRAIRPGLGMPTKYLEIVMGRPINFDAPRGTALSWDLIS